MFQSFAEIIAAATLNERVKIAVAAAADANGNELRNDAKGTLAAKRINTALRDKCITNLQT